MIIGIMVGLLIVLWFVLFIALKDNSYYRKRHEAIDKNNQDLIYSYKVVYLENGKLRIENESMKKMITEALKEKSDV